MNSTLNVGGQLIYQNEKKSIKYKIICIKHIDKLFKSIVVDVPIMFAAQSIVFNEPLYVQNTDNSPNTPFAVNLPFFIKDSRSEYAVNMIIQSIWGVYAVIGLSSVEIGECLMYNTIAAIPDVFRYSLLEFQDEFKVNGVTLRSVARLRNTFIQIQDYKR